MLNWNQLIRSKFSLDCVSVEAQQIIYLSCFSVAILAAMLLIHGAFSVNFSRRQPFRHVAISVCLLFVVCWTLFRVSREFPDGFPDELLPANAYPFVHFQLNRFLLIYWIAVALVRITLQTYLLFEIFMYNIIDNAHYKLLLYSFLEVLDYGKPQFLLATCFPTLILRFFFLSF